MKALVGAFNQEKVLVGAFSSPSRSVLSMSIQSDNLGCVRVDEYGFFIYWKSEGREGDVKELSQVNDIRGGELPKVKTDHRDYIGCCNFVHSR